jgi:hypothetical protein
LWERRARTMQEGSKDIVSQPTEDDLRVYEAFSKLPFPKSYAGKMLLVAFIGTHVPLVALASYFALASSVPLRDKVRVLFLALVATLGGAAATLLGLRALLAPCRPPPRRCGASWIAASCRSCPPTTQTRSVSS